MSYSLWINIRELDTNNKLEVVEKLGEKLEEIVGEIIELMDGVESVGEIYYELGIDPEKE